MRTRRQIQPERRAPARLPVHVNLSAAGFTGYVCERANEREQFIRGGTALNVDVTLHFPVAMARDDRVFAGWKISDRLRRYAFSHDLPILASQQKGRSWRFGANIESTFASDQSKQRQLL